MRYAALALLALCPVNLVQAKDEFFPRTIGKGSSETYILAVGIDTYQDRLWPSLQFASQDARQMVENIGQGSGRKIPLLMTNGEATREHLLQALLKLKQTVGPSDTVILYFSGHGTLDLDGQGNLQQVLVTQDTKKSSPLATGVTHVELRSLIDKIPAKRKLLILATCYSGIGKSRLNPKVEQFLAAQKGELPSLEKVSDQSLVLAASARGETAREDGRLKGDIYTHFFLTGLRAGDRNRDGVVTALEAHDFAAQRTYEYTQGKQRPTLELQALGASDIPLSGQQTAEGLPVLDAYDADLSGLSVEVNKGTPLRLPAGAALSLGRNEVRVFSEVGTRRREVAELEVRDCRAGETLKIEDLLAPPPFEIAAGYRMSFWQSARTSNLLGTRYDSIPVSVRYLHNSWSLGLVINQGSLIEQSVRPGIDLWFRSQSAALEGGWRWDLLPRLSGDLGLHLAYEKATVKLEDKATSNSVEKSHHALAAGVFGRFKYSITDRVQTFSKFLWLQGQHDFSPWGEVSTGRLSTELGVSMPLGGRARRR